MHLQNTRNKYDTFLIWLYNQNKEHLIPKELRKRIPDSTASGWRNLDYSNYVGHEVNTIQKKAIEQFEVFEKYKNLKKVVNTLTKVWVSISNLVVPILTKSKENKILVLDGLQQLFQVLPRKLALKIFSISPTTFFNWIAVDKVKPARQARCGISPLDLCFNRHPLQLAKKEVKKIKSLFKNPDFQCWPASSIYYYTLRNEELFISLSTFYKYVNLLGLKRKWKKSALENTNPLVTTKPNEFIHIDTTFWPLPNGIKAAIILVCDNFSKTILGWNVSLKSLPAGRHGMEKMLKQLLKKLLQKYKSTILI